MVTLHNYFFKWLTAKALYIILLIGSAFLFSCNQPSFGDLYIKLPINSNDIKFSFDSSNQVGSFSFNASTYFNSDSIISKYGIDPAKINKLILSDVAILMDSNNVNSEKNLNFISNIQFMSALEPENQLLSTSEMPLNVTVTHFPCSYDIRAFKSSIHSYIFKGTLRKKVEDVKVYLVLSYEVNAALADKN